MLAAAAFVATGATLRRGGPRDEEPLSFALIPLLAGGLFLAGLFASFAREPKIGWVRGCLLVGSALLATAAVVFAEVGSGTRLALGYWLPAALAMASAVMLTAPAKHAPA